MGKHTERQLLHEPFNDADILAHCVGNTQSCDPSGAVAVADRAELLCCHPQPVCFPALCRWHSPQQCPQLGTLSLVGVEGLISCPSPYSAPGVFPTGDSTCRQGWVWVFLLLVKVTAKHFWVFELHKMLSRLALCISPLLSQSARALKSCLIALVRMSLYSTRVADGPRAGSGAQLGASGLAVVTGTKSFQVLPPRSSVLVPPLRGGTDAAVRGGAHSKCLINSPPAPVSCHNEQLWLIPRESSCGAVSAGVRAHLQH